MAPLPELRKMLATLARRVLASRFGRPFRRWWIWHNYPKAYAAHRPEVAVFVRSGQRLTNFYYDLENEDEGLDFVSRSSDVPREDIRMIVGELRNSDHF